MSNDRMSPTHFSTKLKQIRSPEDIHKYIRNVVTNTLHCTL